MSKRNLVLLIIFLMIAGTVVFLLFSSYKPFEISTQQTEDTNFVSKFFPFGKSSKVTPPETDDSPVDISGYIPPSNQDQNAKLIRVTNLPVAGYGIYLKERFKEIPVTTDEMNLSTESTQTSINKKGGNKPSTPPTEFIPSIRYVEKTTGNIYETFADKIEEKKFSDVVIPQVYDAYFGNNGESVIMRYLKGDQETIETVVGTLPKEKLGEDILSVSEMSTSFLPENVFDLSLSSDSSKLFYLFNSSDQVVGINANATGDKKSQVFSSPFSEWLSSYPNNKTITLTTKPSNSVPGYLYILNPDSKNITKTLSGINGLTTLTSPDGKLVLYSGSDLALKIYNVAKKTLVSTGAKTLPEKCTWDSASSVIYCAVPKYISGENYPDSWYMGENSFDDEIWKIEAGSGNASFITDPSQLPGGESIDGIKLAIDSGENYLFFLNKTDFSLWRILLK